MMVLGTGMAAIICGDGWGWEWLLRGWGGNGDNVKNSSGVGWDGDNRCENGRGWGQVFVPVQLSMRLIQQTSSLCTKIQYY